MRTYIIILSFNNYYVSFGAYIIAFYEINYVKSCFFGGTV